MDADNVWPVSGIHAHVVLTRVFSEFFRWQALRDEGRLTSHRRLHVAAIVS
jgi:hypothetical protein